jgi:hypothetical protein
MRTFDPAVQPSFAFQTPHQWRTSRSNPVKPYGQLMPVGPLPTRSWPLTYKKLSVVDVDYIVSFFHEHMGGATSFMWRPSSSSYNPSSLGPVLDQGVQAGAPAGSRDYQASYTWYTTELDEDENVMETTPSPLSSLTVAGGSVLTVALPPFPNGVETARIYAAESSAVTLQASTTVRLWTEPQSGLVVTGAPPTVGNMRPLVEVTLETDLIVPVKTSARTWSISLQFMERFG